MAADNAQEVSASNDPITQLFTPREQLMIVHGFICMKDIPAIDYAKVADRMGLKNPRSVGNAWGQIRKKVQAFDKEDRKRKGLPSEDEAEPDAAADAADGENAKPTPKRARTAKAAGGGTPRSARAKKVGKAPATPKTPRAKKSGLLVDAADMEEEREDNADGLVGIKLEEGVKEEENKIKLEADEDADELGTI